MKTVGEILVELRGGRSQAEVSNAIGISVSALSAYENNQRMPRDGVKIKIARYYKKTVQSIFFAEKVHNK